MDKYPLHRTGATGHNRTSERTQYERSILYPLPRSKGKGGEGKMSVEKWIEVKVKYCDKCYNQNHCRTPCPLVSALWDLPCEKQIYEMCKRTPQNDEVRE